MKQFVALFLCFLMICSVALADIDVSSMSFDELRALQQRINAELVTRPEWKQVTVPAGTWQIGTDIPAGFYSVTALDTHVTIDFINEKGRADYYIISAYETLGRIELLEGTSITINKQAIFAPPVTLGF